MDYASALTKGRNGGPTRPTPMQKAAVAKAGSPVPPSASRSPSTAKTITLPNGESLLLSYFVAKEVVADSGSAPDADASPEILNNLVSEHLPKTSWPNFTICAELIDEEGNNSKKKISEFSRDVARKALIDQWLQEGVMAGSLSLVENSDTVFASSSLANLDVYPGAVVSLLKNSTHEEVEYRDGKMTFTRFGPGGSYLLLKTFPSDNSEGIKKFYKTDDFAVALLDEAKEFTNIVGRVIVALKQGAKDVKTDDLAEYSKKEQKIASTLQGTAINEATRAIRRQLQHGAVPGSKYPRRWEQQNDLRQREQHQLTIENENMVQDVVNNLPADFERVKALAQRMNNDWETRRFEQRNATREAARAESSKNNDGASKSKNDQEKAEKLKVVVTKTVDKDGWTTTKKTKVTADGKVARQAKKAPVANAASTKKSAPARVPMKENAFALTMQAGSFESIEEVQHKRNLKKKEQNAQTPNKKKPKSSNKQTKTNNAQKNAQKSGMKNKSQKNKKKNRGQTQNNRVAVRTQSQPGLEGQYFTIAAIALIAIIGLAAYSFLFSSQTV